MWTLGLIVRRWFVIVSVKMVTVYYIISSINLMKSTVSVAVVLYEYSVCLGSGGALERKKVKVDKNLTFFLLLYVDIMCIECL